MIVGAYVVHYGWYEIGLHNNPTDQDPVIGAAGTMQRAGRHTGRHRALVAPLLIEGVVLRPRTRS
ncbi:hypothetical protein TN53_36570 [Streptomyces sp. WM6386]|nr:hypothetical protein TN53_36570 [Streptomyces sp. WM6386]